MGRLLEPFISGLWIFFLLWTGWIACVWTFAIGDAALGRWIGNRDLRAVLAALLGGGDLLWIAFAAASTHLWLAETEGLPTARRWAAVICGAVAALGAASVITGFPLGRIVYSRPIGVKLGPVPVGLPLLWFALVIGARQCVRRAWPSADRLRLAVGTGVLALLADVNLEPVAAKLRGFWFWRAPLPGAPPQFTPPWTNYAAWFVLASVLAFTLREQRVTPNTRRDSSRPITIFLLLNAVFLGAHLGRLLRG